MKHLLRETGYDPKQTVHFGNKFLVANGYLGVRGTLEEFGKKELAAINLGGLYDQVPGKWREPVNAPNPFFTFIRVDHQIVSLLTHKPRKHQQSLDLYTATHHRETSFQIKDNHVTVKAKRTSSAAEVHTLLLEYQVTVTKATRLEIVTGIDGDVWDINGPHLTDYQMETGPILQLTATTQAKGEIVSVGEVVISDQQYQEYFTMDQKQLLRHLAYELAAGETVTLQKQIAIYHSHETSDPRGACRLDLEGATEASIVKAWQAHQQVWQKRWDLTDVTITGDEEADFALRYSLYQLQIIAPHHRSGLSIPARGLSGQTYKGAVFWDTEMFMMPVFLHHDSRLVRHLLQYRIDSLPLARQKAASYGFRGAFFAWESQEAGYDATSDYNVVDVFTKRPQRTYFKDKQIHISGDIVYALKQYVDYTKDESLLLAGGLEVILEAARFYLSYLYYKPEKDRYEAIDVLGPDEYHERVYNNAYTSKLIQFTIETAVNLTDALAMRYPAEVAAIIENLDFEEDLFALKVIADKIYVPQPNSETELVQQFDGYFQLEDTTAAVLRKRLLDPKEYWGGAYGVASDTQVIKQADTIMMQYLFADEYSQSQLEKNWLYYEPRTEHGSSLSACIYGLVACMIGRQDWAYDYFMKTAQVDLTGESKTFAGDLYIGGTHPAANGGAWMVAILGFCGLAIKNNQVTLQPRLPQKWAQVAFKIKYQGQVYQICCLHDGAKITPLPTTAC